MKRCVKCSLPETYETIEFNKDGICNICSDSLIKEEKIDWAKRKKLLDDLIEKFRGKSNYDCIIPFSGAKDSTFQLYYLMKEYKIKPLVVRFNHGFLRPTIQQNTINTLKKIGADFIEFTPNWKIVKKLMLEAFKRKTDMCWHCHTGIFSYPLRLALLYKVPLVFYGETSSDYDQYYNYLDDEIDYFDEKKFNIKFTLGITADDMHGMISTPEDPVDKRDLIPYTFPDVKDLAKINYCPVALGSFIKWDTSKHTELIKKELGWKTDDMEQIPKENNPNGEKIECFMQGTRDYIKWLKRGYGRMSQINAKILKQGQGDIQQLKILNEKHDGIKPKSLEIFLEYVGLTEEEFNSYIDKAAIPPQKPNFKNDNVSKKMWDFDQWYRENNLKK